MKLTFHILYLNAKWIMYKFHTILRYYAYLFTHWLSSDVRALIDQWDNCEDILMNFLVSHMTKFPPIKLTQHRSPRELSPGSVLGGERSLVTTATNVTTAPPPGPPASSRSSAQHFSRRQQCMNALAQEFGHMPLVRTSLRFDPLLYRDPVSRTRKKYRQIDVTT